MENKELNLVEILKDAPKGTKLWCDLMGDYVKLSSTAYNDTYPIAIYYQNDRGNDFTESFNRRGQYISEYKDGCCLLYPSKENRDWSTFKVEHQIPDKALVECFDDAFETGRDIRFYDAKNKKCFNPWSGKRGCIMYENYKIIATKVEDMPQWAQDAYKKLEN